MESRENGTGKASDGKGEAPRREWIGESDLQIVERGKPALRQLLDAHQFATELGRSVWDFAVEMNELRKLGLTSSDLRWLICRGFLAHGCEVTADGGQSRTVLPSESLTFSKRTCFVALESGIDFICAVLRQSPTTASRAPASLPTTQKERPRPSPLLESARPKWSRDRQELSVGGRVVKQFKVPAPNQELILSVFQEEGWPVRIDDPLPPHPEQDSKRRLHDTINSLNRCQKVVLIRFSGDGKGTGVRWELLSSTETDACIGTED
jgi:hypothetical protein